jgi:hypothetical protein
VNIIKITNENREEYLSRFPEKMFDRPSDSEIDAETIAEHLQFFGEDNECIFAIHPGTCVLFFSEGEEGCMTNEEKEQRLFELCHDEN